MTVTNGMLVGATKEALDDQTQRYIGEVQPCFQTVQEAAGRLAGLLILLEITRSRDILNHPARLAARVAVECACDTFARLTPSARSSHFHYHLAAAVGALSKSFTHIELTLEDKASARDPLVPLRHSWNHLKHASSSLPGFEIIDFSHSCCALHLQSKQY